MPEGYTMRWRVKGGLGKDIAGGFVLRDPEGNELGFFEMHSDQKTIGEVLKDHLDIIDCTREESKIIIDLKDSAKKKVGSWEYGKPANNPIEAIIVDAANI